MSFYGVLKRCYHSCVPLRVRDGLYHMTPRPLLKLRQRLIGTLERSARHDEIYDKDYYERLVDPTMRLSVVPMAESIIKHFRPRTVVDVGCGTGLLLLTLKEKGVRGTGLEYSDAARAICQARGLDVRRFDIEKDASPDIKADLVISTEVAEHLPESCADRFVDLLCSVADHIVLTAAVPGVEGTDHVNEQPNEYWIKKLESRGMIYDKVLSQQWRSHWNAAGVAGCFATTLMLFSRGVGAAVGSQCGNESESTRPSA